MFFSRWHQRDRVNALLLQKMTVRNRLRLDGERLRLVLNDEVAALDGYFHEPSSVQPIMPIPAGRVATLIAE